MIHKQNKPVSTVVQTVAFLMFAVGASLVCSLPVKTQNDPVLNSYVFDVVEKKNSIWTAGICMIFVKSVSNCMWFSANNMPSQKKRKWHSSAAILEAWGILVGELLTATTIS